MTDPFFRNLSSMSSLMRIGQLEQIADQEINEMEELSISNNKSVFDVMMNVLHGEQIGLKIDTEGYHHPVLMSINTDDLWIDPEREFGGEREYTVVGRVIQVLSSRGKWDFLDLLQIMDDAFTEDSIDVFRDELMEFARAWAEEDEDEEYDLEFEINRDDYVVEGPATVVDPIAIYW